MGKILFSKQDNWAGGVNTSAQVDQVGANQTPRAYNSALANISTDRAVLGKRRGMSIMNSAPISGTPQVQGMFQFTVLSGGTFTNYFLIVTNEQRLARLETTGTLTNISGTAFSAGTYFYSFATFKNLCFMVNGVDKKKYTLTAIHEMGIAEPSSAPTLAAGAAGALTGTYEARVTFYNRNTDTESSAGPTSTSVTLAAQQLDISGIPTSGDPQVTTRRVYLRNTATMANFYLAVTVDDASTTSSSGYNSADSTLITLGPDTEENDPPPTGIKYLAVHRSRMFAADDTTLYYSKVNKPENFDPDFQEPVNPNDGQKITGIHAAHDMLLIFKTNSMYALVGDGPEDWAIRLIDPDIGCTSHRSIVTVEGKTYFWSEQGPMVWGGEGNPTPIGLPLISSTISPTSLNFSLLNSICAVSDIVNQRVMFAVASNGSARLDRILPFNYRLGAWESDKWDPMDVASFGVMDDDNGQPWVMLGNYYGQIFKWWSADADGIRPGTSSTLEFTAGASTVTTISQVGAALDTTGNGLIGRRVTIVDSTGKQVGSTRPYIVSNTSTSVTLNASVAVTNGASYICIIGGPALDVDMRWDDSGAPFTKKRYEFLFTEALAPMAAVTLYCDITYNYDITTLQTKSFSIAPFSVGVWDASLWDSAIFATEAHRVLRTRMGKVGRVVGVRYRNFYPNQPVFLQRMGVRAVAETGKLG